MTITNIALREASEADFQAIVDLNAGEVQHTSPMDMERLRHLDRLAAYHVVAVIESEVAAFLFAMREGCAYQNDNYAWFSERYPSFLYIDRIVVNATFADLGIGSLLYQHMFNYASSNDIGAVTCEYNLVPANDRSGRFHTKFGFNEVGTQWLDNKSKQVSLQAAPAPHAHRAPARSR